MDGDSFMAWLETPQSGVHCKAGADYVSRVKRVEERLNIDVNNFLPNRMDALLGLISNDNFLFSNNGLTTLKSAVRKYSLFRNS